MIGDGRVYGVSLGGLMVAVDLLTGRRLWERQVASVDSLSGRQEGGCSSSP